VPNRSRRPLLATLLAALALLSIVAGPAAAHPAEAGRVDGTAAVPTPDNRIAVGDQIACAIRPTGRLFCWGPGPAGLLDAPAGRFVSVDVDRVDACALRTNGRIACWADGHDPLVPPGGRATEVGVGDGIGCALRASDAEVVCWGDELDPPPPTGPLASLSVADGAACAIRGSGQLACWGRLIGGDPSMEAPRGRFVDVELSASRVCALSKRGHPSCFAEALEAVPPPSGKLTRLAVGYPHNCGLRPTQKITCWGHDFFGETDPPAGDSYVELAAGFNAACARREGGPITCWGRQPPPVPDDRHRPRT
jgi:hypothetical protein